MNTRSINQAPGTGLYKTALHLAALVIFFFTLPFTSLAQAGNGYLADLNTLRDLIKKTPSYKDQIKGEALVSYNELFEKLKSDTVSKTADYQYFYNLAQLFFPIRDNHLGMYQVINDDNYKDQPTFEKFITTKEFKDFPKYNVNIDSLEKALSTKPLDSIEGIYHLDTFLTIGLFKRRMNEYIGVVLSSKLLVWRNLNWEKGQIAIHLYEYLPNHFRAIYADPVSKRLILYANEKFSNLQLLNSHFNGFFYKYNYSKVINRNDLINLPRNSYDFHFRNIETGIQYLHIKHFSADKDQMKRSKAFYDSIKHQLTAPNLIVDLRNNEGGAISASKKYLKLIEKYTGNGHVYVLVNNGTVSQGEIFTLQLKQLSNVKVLGQTTNGMLMYGSNYGRTEQLPSNGFRVYMTDMPGDKRLMSYEAYGIDPDIILTDTRDWIEQAVELIRKN